MSKELTDRRRIHQLLHSANNCRQMLGAVDRKLADALQHVYDGNVEGCKTLLEELSKALPEAMAIIEIEEHIDLGEMEPSENSRSDIAAE